MVEILILLAFTGGLVSGVFFYKVIKDQRKRLTQKTQLEETPTSWLLDELSKRNDIEK